MKIKVVLLIIFLICLSSNAYSYTVVSDHPRIFLRSADIATMQIRVTDPAIAVFYNELKTRMDNSSSPHSNPEISGIEMQSLALLHLLESSTAYKDKLMNSWIQFGYSTGDFDHWQLTYQVYGHAIALDWLWNDLTPTERSNIGAVLVAMMNDLYDYAPHDISYSGANQMSDYSNQLYYHLASLPFAGLALYGEGISDSNAIAWMDEAEELLDNHMIPAMNQEAGGDSELYITTGFLGNGGWGEDMGHTGMTHPHYGRMLEAWRSGTGEDFFPLANGLRTLPKYLTYMRRPGGYLSPKGNGSYSTGISDSSMGFAASLVSGKYADQFGKYIKDQSYTGTTYGFHQLAPVLWYDETLPDLDLNSIPKSMHFQGQGEVVVRSGFSTNDTWVYFHAGPFYNGHQHEDQGQVLIEAYGGELFVENAGNGDSISRAVNHNTFLIGGSQIPTYYASKVQYAQPLEGTEYEYGKITTYAEGAEFTYSAADFGKAYPDGQVSSPKEGKVTREMVVISPDIVVLRDRVQGNGTVEFLMHTWDGAATLNATEKTVISQHGSGHGWMKTLLPGSANLSMTDQGATDLISIRATTGQAIETFFTVFYLSPDSVNFIPSDVAHISDDASLRVSLSDRNGDKWQIAFNSSSVGLIDVQKNGDTVPIVCEGDDCSDIYNNDNDNDYDNDFDADDDFLSSISVSGGCGSVAYQNNKSRDVLICMISLLVTILLFCRFAVRVKVVSGTAPSSVTAPLYIQYLSRMNNEFLGFYKVELKGSLFFKAFFAPLKF